MSLSEDQHPHEMTLIAYYSLECKLQVDSRVTYGHQCHTPATLSRVYLEELGKMFFYRSTKYAKISFAHSQIISKDLLHCKNLICRESCSQDKKYTHHLSISIPLFFGIFIFKALGIHLS